MALCSVARLPLREDSHRPALRSTVSDPQVGSPRVDIELLPRDVARASVVDPHDETLEIEITEDMINLALESVEEQQVWPYAADRRLVARPVRCARIIRFPGC